MIVPYLTFSQEENNIRSHENTLSSERASTFGITSEWANDLETKARVLRMKTQLLEGSLAKENFEEVKDRVSEIRSYIRGFEGTDFQILPEADTIQRTIDDAVKTCNLVTAALRIDTTRSSTYTSQQDSLDEGYKLNPLDLPTFDGKYENWQPFWQQYEPAVHSNPKISLVMKHRILLSILKGAALRAIEGVTPCNENYQKVISTVQSRFGDPKRLTSIYYSKLEKLDRATEPHLQRSNFDEINKILANLSALGVQTDEEYLKERIIKKFSMNTLRWVWVSLEPKKDFSVSELMKALETVVSRDDDIHHYFRDEPSTSKSERKTPGTVPALMGGNSTCIFCNGQHRSEDCRRFGTLVKRKAQLIAAKRCLTCGEIGHRFSRCSLKRLCSFCKKEGHTMLTCVSYMARDKGVSGNEAFENFTFLETFRCKLNGAEGYVEVRGILDGGSLNSYITEALARKLGLISGQVSLTRICSFGSDNVLSESSSEVLATVQNHKLQEIRIRLRTIGCITGKVISSPSPNRTKDILPPHLVYADPDIFKNSSRNIDILIGNDMYNKLMHLTEVKTLPCGVILKNSFFGWIPSGSLENNSVNVCIASPRDFAYSTQSALPPDNAMTVTHPSNDASETYFTLEHCENLCSLLWSLEVIGIRSSEINDVDDKVLEDFRKTVRRDSKTGRYIVRWPWKENRKPDLDSNYRMCMARFRNMLKSPRETLEQCQKNFSDQESLGVIERAPYSSPFPTHYIPWQALLKKGKKLRVVYDASAKTKTGKSLNDLLCKGPKLIGDLTCLLINFRIHPVALSADIEKAFLQIGLNEVDRDVTRFIWVKDFTKEPTNDNVVIFRFARVPFGVISSPFLLNVVLQEILASPNKWLSLAKNCFYVDNLVTSVRNTISAINLHNALKPKLASAGFNLRDWTSNDPNFVTAVEGTVPINPEPMSILGLDWNRVSDTLAIKVHYVPTSELVSKRIMLKFISSIYDPLGLASAATLPIKLLLQETWKQKISWDDLLPPHLQARWLKLYEEIKDAIKTPIPRQLWSFENEGKINLHVFCDASEEAYSCTAYLSYVNENDGNHASVLILSKARMAPMQKLSIPRLELLGVLIGKRIAIYLLSGIQLSVEQLTIWTDATTVLHWLNSNALQSKFVENRLREIRQPLDTLVSIQNRNFTIRYVPTSLNPADLATRGTRAEKLFQNELWWHGPVWLPYPLLWPSPPASVEIFSALATNLPTLLVTRTVDNESFLPDNFEKRFSSWDKYARLYGMVLRFCANILNIPDTDSDTDMFQRGERALIRALQLKYFKNEIIQLQKGLQPNCNLELFLDDLKLIRCKGRLQNASFPWETIHPILLPRKSPITAAYVRKIHIENMHIGCSHVLAKIRERFWICKGRALVKPIVRRCTNCKLWTGGSYQLPQMPPLPWVRVTEASPFLHCGLDYLGPINVLTEAGLVDTAHVALFVCLVTRAVHLELARDLSANEFLMAFIRFTSRRGSPKFVISDNASNLVFVQPLVGTQTQITDIDTRRYFSTNNIRWKFIPQYAPWYGGAYERLVALVKSCLKKSFGRRQVLSYVGLSTALCQAEEVINSRPLTYVSDELLTPLTPNHFLRLRSCNANNVVEVSTVRIRKSTKKEILQLWQEVNALVEDFWCAFRSTYLLALREKHCSTFKKGRGSIPFRPKVGDVVLIKHPSAARADWAIGKITNLDKRQAIAELYTKGEKITRTINQLFPFELVERPQDSTSNDSTVPGTSK